MLLIMALPGLNNCLGHGMIWFIDARLRKVIGCNLILRKTRPAMAAGAVIKVPTSSSEASGRRTIRITIAELERHEAAVRRITSHRILLLSRLYQRCSDEGLSQSIAQRGMGTLPKSRTRPA